MEYCIINCTVSSKDEALKISKELIKDKLIACCNIVSSVTSVYEWKNALQEDTEFLLIMKTKTELFEQVKEKIEKLHSYEIPEIIAIPIIKGNENYLNWIKEKTNAVI